VFWTDITHLNRGSDRQRDAYQAMIELDIFSVLGDYDPVLAGTLPLGIETPESDLDILCEAEDLDRFDALVEAAYGDLDEFRQQRSIEDGLPSSTSSFRFRRFPVEIFAQACPVDQQRAYRHMVAEGRLLREGGEEAVGAIRQLKLEGLETEPAFGEYFCLDGDPYAVLAAMADAPTEELVNVVVQARMARRNRPQLLYAVAQL
jgi:hypothetical protein